MFIRVLPFLYQNSGYLHFVDGNAQTEAKSASRFLENDSNINLKFEHRFYNYGNCIKVIELLDNFLYKKRCFNIWFVLVETQSFSCGVVYLPHN